VFVACLPYSDYSFAMAVRSQHTEDLLYALGCCLQELGGVPLVLVPDNLKSAVVKASLYEPDINRAMEDFANHYHTTVMPARARKPKYKALVENQVKLIYTRSMVYIYGKGQQIAVHERKHRIGTYSTLKEHLCSHHQHYLSRSPENIT
jgi:transposase